MSTINTDFEWKSYCPPVVRLIIASSFQKTDDVETNFAAAAPLAAPSKRISVDSRLQAGKALMAHV